MWKGRAPSRSSVLKSQRQLKREARQKVKLPREEGGQADGKEGGGADDVLGTD
jgi:hypothetical protein